MFAPWAVPPPVSGPSGWMWVIRSSPWPPVEGGRLPAAAGENGQGRRTALGEYRTQNRGGRGIRNSDCEGKGTLVAGVRVVGGEDDVILIADDGIIIRIPCEQIAVQSRYGGGVHAMRLEEGSRVVALAAPPARRTPKKPMGRRPPSPRKQVMKM